MGGYNRYNLIGQKFNKLLVIEDVGTGADRQSLWKCKCDCGNEVIVRGYQLVKNRTKSCGCLRSFKYANNREKTGENNNNWKGDDVKPRAYHTWLRKHYPKPELCQHCNNKPPIDLASINGHNYTRDINDYMWLCRSCHKEMDNANKI